MDGETTSREVVKAQYFVFWSFVPTTPHCTGSRWASLSASGRWHAALIAALQVNASGIASWFEYLRTCPWINSKMNIKKPRLTASQNMINGIFYADRIFLTYQARNKAISCSDPSRFGGSIPSKSVHSNNERTLRKKSVKAWKNDKSRNSITKRYW